MAETTLKIEGVHPTIDGEYPIAVDEFTNRDFNDIKRIAHVRVQELSEAFAHYDSDLFVAFAVIALRHAGKPVIEDLLWDAPIGKITLVSGDEEEADDLPPASAPPSEAPSGLGGGERLNESSGLSGTASSNGSDHPENDQNPTGPPPSDTGVTSGSEMWAN